jgi:hypothetical protein
MMYMLSVNNYMAICSHQLTSTEVHLNSMLVERHDQDQPFDPTGTIIMFSDHYIRYIKLFQPSSIMHFITTRHPQI